MKLHHAILAAALAAALLAGPAPHAAAAPRDVAANLPASTPANPASPDYDGDGRADLAVSDGEYAPLGIRVWYGSGAIADIVSADLSLPGSWDLNADLLARDLDGDGYTDLVATSSGAAGIQVHVIPGSPTGLRPSQQKSFVVRAKAGSWQVQELALVESPVRRLAVSLVTWVDAADPYYRGEIRLYELTKDGQPTGGRLTLKPGSGKIPASLKRGDFGASMASWKNQLFIGAPDTKVNQKASAGAVLAVTLDAKGVKSARTLTQSTTFVGGVAGKQHFFGAALAARDGYLVVGTPWDDVGRVRHTGSIQVFSLTKGKISPIRRISQATPGIPGKAEYRDRFGAQVAIGSTCNGVPAVLVGGPGEAIVNDEVDGSAWLIPLRTAKGCKAAQLYEGHGLPGTPHFRGIGGVIGFVRDSGRVDDDLVIGGGGYIDEMLGRLFWVSSKTGKALLSQDAEFARVAGR